MNVTAARQEFYERLNRKNTAPLWEVLADLFAPEPRSACVPTLWKYREIRPLLIEAGGLITQEEAQRRVLILENPGIRPTPQITRSLYAGLQLILPGEVARSHRHAASALRFVLESKGAYTAVEGERTIMQPGDFVVTPSWTFHDHGNDGGAPAIWMDGLDHPMVNFFDAGFIEKYPELQQPVRPSSATPAFSYPYSKSRETLDTLYRNSTADSRHGIKMPYVNPVTGGYPMPTIAAFLQLLPAGFRGRSYRSTDGTIFCCTEGHGRSRIGESVFEWGAQDIFVVPSWVPVAHDASEDAVLFSFSDRPAQQALGLWREQDL